MCNILNIPRPWVSIFWVIQVKDSGWSGLIPKSDCFKSKPCATLLSHQYSCDLWVCWYSYQVAFSCPTNHRDWSAQTATIPLVEPTKDHQALGFVPEGFSLHPVEAGKTSGGLGEVSWDGDFVSSCSENLIDHQKPGATAREVPKKTKFDEIYDLRRSASGHVACCSVIVCSLW